MSNAVLYEKMSSKSVLARLVTDQLVVRVVLAGRQRFPGCRIELMSALKELECDKKTSAFIHTVSDFYWHTERHRLFSSIKMDTAFYSSDAVPPQSTEPFLEDVGKVMDYWKRDWVPNAETPQAEWLEAKPFVGMLVAGLGGSPTQRLILPREGRPFLSYYGLLHAQLLTKARALATMDVGKDLEQRAEIARHAHFRFESFFTQIQQSQFTQALDAI